MSSCPLGRASPCAPFFPYGSSLIAMCLCNGIPVLCIRYCVQIPAYFLLMPIWRERCGIKIGRCLNGDLDKALVELTGNQKNCRQRDEGLASDRIS